MACVNNQDLMLAHLYNLLSDEKSRKLEEDLRQSQEYQETLEHSERKKELFGAWEAQEPPKGLVASTMARIRRSTEASTNLHAGKELAGHSA